MPPLPSLVPPLFAAATAEQRSAVEADLRTLEPEPGAAEAAEETEVALW